MTGSSKSLRKSICRSLLSPRFRRALRRYDAASAELVRAIAEAFPTAAGLSVKSISKAGTHDPE
jgi:hypothetical protein